MLGEAKRFMDASMGLNTTGLLLEYLGGIEGKEKKTHPFEVDISKSGVGACLSALSPVLCSPTSTLIGALEVLSSRIVEALNVPCIAPFLVTKLP